MTELEKAVIVYNRLNKVRRGPRRGRRIRKAIRTIERLGLVTGYDGEGNAYVMHKHPPKTWYDWRVWQGHSGMTKFD